MEFAEGGSFEGSFRLGCQLEFDQLLERVWVAARHRTPVHEYRRGTGHIERHAVLLISFDGFGRLRGRKTCLESFRIQPGLRGKLIQLVPHVFGGDGLLIFVNRVVDFP